MTKPETGTAATCGHQANTGEPTTKFFAESPPRNLRWDTMVAALESIGYTFKPRGGSIFSIHKARGHIIEHRPHPGNEMYPRSIRKMSQLQNPLGFATHTDSQPKGCESV